MKKQYKVTLAIGIGLVLAGVLTAFVVAQTITPDPQSTHVQIANISDQEATVVVEVYNAETEALEATETFTIAANAKMAVHSTAGTNRAGHRYLNLPSGFKGSMVVSSDQPLVVVANTAGGESFSSYASYEGIDSSYADTEVFVPSVHWRNGQWAMVAIQNTGSVAATVVYTYLLQDGTVVGTGSVNVEPGRSNIRNVASDISIGTWPQGFGAMQISSSEPVGVAVWETLQKYTNAFRGFPSWYGDTTIYIPSVHHNPAGHYTHILVQNMDPVMTATVTITYYQQTGDVANAYDTEIGPNGALTFHTNGALSSDGRSYEPTNLNIVGNAVIVSDRPLIVATREVMGGKPYAYNGFRSDAGATELFFPSVHANPGGQYSHILIQNLSDSLTNTIRLEYYRQDGSPDSVYTKTLSASGSINFHTTGAPSPDGRVYAPTAGFGNVGAAKVISVDGLPIVGLCTEVLRGIPSNYAGFAP